MGKIVMIAVIGFLILFVVTASMGCERFEPVAEQAVETKEESWFDFDFGSSKIKDQPPREFKERCEITFKAFHFFKNIDDKWACKLDDGRVLVEGNSKPTL